MQAKVIKQFDAVENGAIYPRAYVVGEIVSGSLAEVALAEGWAEEVKSGRPAPVVPVEIANGWQDLKAAEMVKLAHALGANADVNTKAEAAVFIHAQIDRRAAPVG